MKMAKPRAARPRVAKAMRPEDQRGTWKAEKALARVRRCLGLLRTGNFISAAEQGRISARVGKWRKHQTLRQVVKLPAPSGKPAARPSVMRHTIEERFRAFHAANPAVYKHLLRLTRELYQHGRERIGIRCLWEQIRWHVAMGIIRVEGEYKLNDQYTSRYVRMLIHDVPAWKSLFEIRFLRAL